MNTLIKIISILYIFCLIGCGGSKNNPLNETSGFVIHDLNSTGSDPIVGNSAKNEKPSTVISKDSKEFLENLKNQYYKNNVKVVDLPEDDQFEDVEKITIDEFYYYYLPSVISDKKATKSYKTDYPLLVANLRGAFYLNSQAEDEYIFNMNNYGYQYDATSNLEYHDGAFFRLNKDGWVISGIMSNKDDLVYHLYSDKKTLGVFVSVGLDVKLKIKNESTNEESDIELKFINDEKSYLDDIGDKGAYFVDSTDVDGSAPSDSSTSTASENDNSTGTNNQVTGVDERDSVKRIGDYICFIRNDTLVGYNIKTEAEVTLALDIVDSNQTVGLDQSLDLVSGDSLYYYHFERHLHVVGDSLVVIASVNSKLKLLFFSVGESFELQKSLEFNATNITSRVIDNKLLMIFGNYVYPVKTISGLLHYSFTEKQKEEFEAKNEKLLSELTLADFNINPDYKIINGDIETEASFDIENNINFPENSGGSFLAYMSSFDSEGELLNNTTIALDHIENAYVTSNSIYIYLTEWSSRSFWWDEFWSTTKKTIVYAFDMSENGIEYFGSGEIDGHLNNTFSLHESGDYLFGVTNTLANDNQIVSLKRQNGVLSQVSSVEGIAPGETIQSVRFIGEKAYVVTFRRTDPLYVVDISNPEALLMKGELKVNGFSSYLHPIYDGIIMGVGRSGDEDGLTNGGKVSTFDVKDDSQPFEVNSSDYFGQGKFGWMYFGTDNDHHAFNWASWLGLAAVVGYEDSKEYLYLIKIDNNGLMNGFLKLNNDVKDLYWSDKSRSMFIEDTLYYIRAGQLIKYDVNSLEFDTKNF